MEELAPLVKDNFVWTQPKYGITANDTSYALDLFAKQLGFDLNEVFDPVNDLRGLLTIDIEYE